MLGRANACACHFKMQVRVRDGTLLRVNAKCTPVIPVIKHKHEVATEECIPDEIEPRLRRPPDFDASEFVELLRRPGG